MNAHITEFLEQVRPFLVAADEQDILREIAGSIEDREAAMPGGGTDENMVAVIAAMGDPRDVAAAWSTGRPAVAVNYLKVQWLLTGLLYAVTVGMAAISAVAGGSIFMAPIFYVPSLTPLSLLYYLPFSFVFDYGLASILIQVNEHFGNRVGIEWALGIARRERDRGRGARPTTHGVVGGLMGVVGALMLHLVARFGIPYVAWLHAWLQGPVRFLFPIPFFVPFTIWLLAMSAVEFVVTCLYYARNWPAYELIGPLASMFALLVAATLTGPPVQSIHGGAMPMQVFLVMWVLVATWDLFKAVTAAFFDWNAAPEA